MVLNICVETFLTKIKLPTHLCYVKFKTINTYSYTRLKFQGGCYMHLIAYSFTRDEALIVILHRMCTKYQYSPSPTVFKL
jgi:hypothetical protein